jgi:hypothetical protein
MNTLKYVVAALCTLVLPVPGLASVLWEVQFTSLAYDTVTGAVGTETATYRYDPAGLTLVTTCGDGCGAFGPAYTLDGTLASYTYEGVTNGSGGSARLWADNPSFFYNSVNFGGTTASDLFADGEALRTPFWADPHELSGAMTWFTPNGEGRVPLVGGEGDFVWITDISDFQSLTGEFAPQSGLTLQFSVSRLPEPGSAALLATTLIGVFASGWTRTKGREPRG